MKNIFDDIKNSLYNRGYYRDLVNQPFSHSIKYYCALILVLGIVVTMVGATVVVPFFNRLVSGVRETVLSTYPDGLEISVEKGIVKTNAPEPFAITLPAQFKDEAGGKKNLLVIDTSATTSPEKLKSYQTLAVLSHDSLIYENNQDGQMTVQPFSTTSNFQLSKDSIINFFNALEPYYKYLTPLIVLGLFMLVVLIMLGTMLYLLLIAFLVWILAAWNKWDITYLKAYQLSLHFATLGFIVALLSMLVFPGSAAFILFTATLILLALVTFQGGRGPISTSSTESEVK